MSAAQDPQPQRAPRPRARVSRSSPQPPRRGRAAENEQAREKAKGERPPTRSARGGGDSVAGGAALAEPDWELLRQRASLLGGELGASVQLGLAAVQVDFDAFQRLQERGQLPTLIEEIQARRGG